MYKGILIEGNLWVFGVDNTMFPYCGVMDSFIFTSNNTPFEFEIEYHLIIDPKLSFLPGFISPIWKWGRIK